MENKPIIQTRDRTLSISIFRRDKDGQSSYGACLQRSWKDKITGEWKREQINLFPDELLKLAALCNRTYAEILTYVQSQPISAHPAQVMSNENLDDTIPF